MCKSATLGRTCFVLRHLAAWITLGATLLAAEVADTSGLASYIRAVSRPRVADRLQQLEQFLATTPGSSLRLDALQLLTWDSIRTGDTAAALKWAQELYRIDPDNPLAIFARLNSRQEEPLASGS